MPVGGRPTNLSSCQRKLSPAVKQSLFQLDATVIGSESGVGQVAPTYNHGGLPRRKSSSSSKKTKSRSSSACVFRSLNCFRNSNDDDDSDNDHRQAPETTTTPTNPPTKMHGPTLPQKRLELRRQRQGSIDTHSMGQSVTTVDSDETVKHHNQSARTQRTVATAGTSGSASTTKSITTTTTTTTRKRNLKKSIKKKSASDKYPQQ